MQEQVVAVLERGGVDAEQRKVGAERKAVSILEHVTGKGTTDPLVELLIRQALSDEELISQMADAIRRGDKQRVFELAKELTHVD